MKTMVGGIGALENDPNFGTTGGGGGSNRQTKELQKQLDDMRHKFEILKEKNRLLEHKLIQEVGGEGPPSAGGAGGWHGGMRERRGGPTAASYAALIADAEPSARGSKATPHGGATHRSPLFWRSTLSYSAARQAQRSRRNEAWPLGMRGGWVAGGGGGARRDAAVM